MTEGYFQTPNKMIPLNDRPPGDLAPVAIDQLMPYQELADTWPVSEHVHEGRESRCCSMCDQTIWFIFDPGGRKYEYSDGEIQALIVAHIRRNHEIGEAINGVG